MLYTPLHAKKITAKSRKQFISETGRKFKDRPKENLCNIRKEDQVTPLGAHFNLPGQNMSDLKATLLEKCRDESRTYRMVRESWFINKSKICGINRKMQNHNCLFYCLLLDECLAI